MNKKIFTVAVVLVFVFTGSAVGIVTAQVPAPTCVDAPGIPCPGHKPVGPLQTPELIEVPQEGESATFENELSKITTDLGILFNTTKENLRNLFGGIFDGLRKKFNI